MKIRFYVTKFNTKTGLMETVSFGLMETYEKATDFISEQEDGVYSIEKCFVKGDLEQDFGTL